MAPGWKSPEQGGIRVALSDLIRWGGLVAVVAAALFVVADLVVVVLAFDQQPAEGLLFRGYTG
jgi:hypothetical protein